MKYRANPVEVDAFVILGITPKLDGEILYHELKLDNGQRVRADGPLLARMTPQIGDYWVIQSDGYVYLNPKAVFERKYSPVN